MEESSIFRAITIAVGVFIAIATITAVLTYYNTAKDMVQAIGTGTDYGEVYTDYVENILIKFEAGSYITGTELVNLINYFYKDEKTEIYITNMKPLFKHEGENNDSLTLSNINNNEELYNKRYSQIVPSQKFEIIERKYDSGNLTIRLRGK